MCTFFSDCCSDYDQACGEHGDIGEEIAFSAGLSGDRIVGRRQKVVYDRVFTNVGLGYSPRSGVFTVPQSGIYVLQVHALARTGEPVYLQMKVNQDYVMSLHGLKTNEYASASNAVILALDQGDEVYVANGKYVNSKLYGVSDEVYCTFSGYYIDHKAVNTPAVGL